MSGSSNKKLDLLNDNIEILKDIVLKMKNEFDLLRRQEREESVYSKFLSTSVDGFNIFLENRPKTCKVLDQCTNLIKGDLFEISKSFSKEGYLTALEQLDKYISQSQSYFENNICQDSNCLKNALDIAIELKRYLETLAKSSINYDTEGQEIDIRDQILEGNEKRESEIFSALANENRLKLLKFLGKGDHSYTQLERKIGLIGGHFKFHLKKLVDTELVSQDPKERSYSITILGLKALNFIQGLNRYTIPKLTLNQIN